jgi:intracellular sulfur oxidation DsrE/DsrF family protein
VRYVLLIILLATTLLSAETKKFLVDLTTGDMETFTTRFLAGVPGTTDYFAKAGDTVEIAVVIHGDAYRFFVANLENTRYWADEQLANEHEAIQKRLAEIRKNYAVTLEMCQVGMNKRGILSADIYPFVTPIKSAMTGLITWQNNGFAYIPIH